VITLSESNTVILKAKIIHRERKEVLDTVEKTIGFIELESEDYEARNLEEIVNDFVQSIQKVCDDKKVQIFDEEMLRDDLTIALALSSRLKDEEGKLSIDVLVIDAQHEGEDGVEQK
jgi:hypothetical protein